MKYHTGETPHPNKFDPSKAFQIMSEAETDDEIIEVNPGDYKIHNGVEKQMGQTVQMGQAVQMGQGVQMGQINLLVPPPMRTNSRPNSRYDGAKAFMKLHLSFIFLFLRFHE